MSVCDVPVISTVCNTVGEGAASLVAAPFDWLANAIGQAAKWMFEGVWAIFDSTTLVDVTSPGYVAVYNILFGVAIFVMLIFFCLQLITGLMRRDATALSKAALGLAKSVLGSFLVLTLTGTALEVVDQLCIGIVQATGTTMAEMGGKIGVLAAGLTAINLTTPGVGAIVTIFLAGLAISAAAIVWFSLLIRKTLLLVAIVMAPIALSGAAWEAPRGWFGKWAYFVLALIVSKLVIVVVFLVATAQLSAPIDFDLVSISQPISGIVLMFVAAFAPYMTYKFISFMGFDMYHSMSAEQEAKNALNRPVPVPNKPTGGAPKKILGGSNTPASSGGSPPPPGGPVPATSASTGAGSVGSAGTAGAGSSGSAAGAGAVSAGAAAGPIGIAAVAGAKVISAAAIAGPKLGAAVGSATDQYAGHAASATAGPPLSPGQGAPATPPPPARPVPLAPQPAAKKSGQ
jgi:hypothetical protein